MVDSLMFLGACGDRFGRVAGAQTVRHMSRNPEL